MNLVPFHIKLSQADTVVVEVVECLMVNINVAVESQPPAFVNCAVKVPVCVKVTPFHLKLSQLDTVVELVVGVHRTCCPQNAI